MSMRRNEEIYQEPAVNKTGIQNKRRKKKSLLYKVLITFLSTSLVIVALLIFLLFTKQGRSIIYGLVSSYAVNNMTTGDDVMGDFEGLTHTANPDARKEDYVTNLLLLGVEAIGGGKRTDSIMIASINTKDNSIKLTSFLRDLYVEIPGYNGNKLNSAFEKGGAQLLVDVIELNFSIYIDAYAYVDFESFEKVVDLLGGVEIELGETEAAYLRKTNYISKKEYRDVQAGLQTLNGNQALGYCRVRKVETLGGANSDYGRTLRQRRVLKAIFEKYKTKNIIELVSIMNNCIKFVNTNLTSNQVKKALSDIVENGITSMESERIPVNDAFTEEKSYKNVGWVLVPDYQKNIEALYKFIYLDE